MPKIAKWKLHIEPAQDYTPTLTGACHYGLEYVAVVDGDGEVVCDNAGYYPQPVSIENARLIAQAPTLLTTTKIAYTILADIRHQWHGRHTAEGQSALSAMRDAIAHAEGRDPKDVQDEFTNAS